MQDAGYRGCPCWVPQEQKAGSASPVDCMEVFLQEAVIHSALAELQLRLGVVVHIVDTHLLHDPKPPLQEREDPVSTLRSAPHLTVAFLLLLVSLLAARWHPTSSSRIKPGGNFPNSCGLLVA